MSLCRPVNSTSSDKSAAMNCPLVRGLLVVDERLRGILLHPLRGNYYVHDPYDRPDHEQDQPPRQPRAQISPGEVRAIPVANGLMVEPITPIPAPNKISAPAARPS